MLHVIQPGYLGIGVILFVLVYTISLIRSEKLSAHIAMSWIIAEIAFLIMMSSESLRASIRSFLGEQNAPYSLFLLGAVWIVFLMLESLVRLSTLTTKLKQVNQDLALTKVRLDRAETVLKSEDRGD